MKYTQHSKDNIAQMLKVIGINDIDELFSDIPPKKPVFEHIPQRGMSEIEIREYFNKLSFKNSEILKYDNFLGGGYYDHYIPSISDALVSRGEFFTAYTPYQPEVSQGALQLIFEYQTMMSEICGLSVSNASMYDGATSFTEAFFMAHRIFRGERNKFIISDTINPVYKSVLRSYLQFKDDIEIVEIPSKNGHTDIDILKNTIDERTVCFGISYPNFYGQIEDLKRINDMLHEKGILSVCAFYPISSSVLKRPGDLGFDIVTGNGQSLGNYMYYSGPTFGFFCTGEEHLRQMPGRIVSETVDLDGKRGFVMTLQTREQHIRRERATSNICSNQTLNTLYAAIYLSFVGKTGFKKLGERIMMLTSYAKDKCINNGLKIKFNPDRVFNEFVVQADNDTEIFDKGLKKGILAGLPLSRFTDEKGLLIAITEMRKKEQIDRLVGFLAEELR